MAPRKVQFLNNKSMVQEVFKSKNSFCSYVEKEYGQFDYVIERPNESLEDTKKFVIQPDQIQRAKENIIRRDAADSIKTEIDDINNNDLIFRIVTWEHIPKISKPIKKTFDKKTAKEIFSLEEIDVPWNDDESIINGADLQYVKLNFVPFQHFKLNDDNELICVGKSHWIGGMENGYFSMTHGRLTEKLGAMIIMLVTKLGGKGNYRGYSYIEDMIGNGIRHLCHTALKFTEARIPDVALASGKIVTGQYNVFSYLTSITVNNFSKTLNDEKRKRNVRDQLIEQSGGTPSFARQAEKWQPKIKKEKKTAKV
jgi:hypothetical protein